MTTPLEALWNGIEQSQLLGREQLRLIRSLFSQESDPRSVAQNLVARGVLTRWQAGKLLSGKGLLLGSYRLVEPLGRGSMGTVYRAEHVKMRRTVALKVINSRRIGDQQTATRFLREIRSIAQLNHPNIVTAYDAGSCGGRYFLAMEYVTGQTLKQWMTARGPLPIGWSCEVIRQVALGLQHAFEQGVVHRDIKPANLLLVASGPEQRPLVKLLDLGLSRLLSEADHPDCGLTMAGQGLGTYDYMAPEQIADAYRADVRADIFALGCTLFEMLTASRPFHGTTDMQRLAARTREDAIPMRSLRADAPAELEAIIAKMLARDPHRRYATPAEVAAQLAPFAAGLATPPGDEPPKVQPAQAKRLEEGTDSSLDAFLHRIEETRQETRPHFSRGRPKSKVPWWKRLFR